MYISLHDRFQAFLDRTVEQSISIHEKKETIKRHLLSFQNEYEKMLLSFFEDEELTEENYFYITYTYLDLPINMLNPNEIVVSMLYELDRGLYFELVVFNETTFGNETKEIFSAHTDFYS